MQTVRSLALRDMPTMALLGTLAGSAASGDASFGSDRRGGADFGDDYGAVLPMSSFGGYSPEFGNDMGAEALAPPPPPAPAGHAGQLAHHAPNPHNPRHHHALLQAWHYMHGRKQHTGRRLALLNPNEHSDVKVEAYVFSLNPSQFATTPTLIWGTANGWTAFKNPQVPFRAERVFVNVNFPGVAYLENIQAANVNAQIGSTADAFSFSPLAVGTKLSLPTLPPQNTMQVQGTWTTFIPPAFQSGASFLMAIDFQGWATVIA
jgi:hypothetical protein